ncbi:MAG TPA: hypothetical protein DEA96_08195 [Leptospiraceae bacterium]|nr:hypothetical protein [Leptospiraceae bacterium]
MIRLKAAHMRGKIPQSCRNHGRFSRQALMQFLVLILSVLLLPATCKKAAEIPGILLKPPGEGPEVTDSSPRPGSGGVKPETKVYLQFDRPMNKRSVQDSFSLSGTVRASGSFRWEGNRLYYDLDRPLQPGESYELTLSKNASDTEGKTLALPYYVSFFAGSRVDGPGIESSIPAPNATGAPPGTAIEINFSRPMDESSVEKAFSINPSMEGFIQWSEDSISFRFMPYKSLEVGRSYQINVSSDARDREGIALANRYSSNFQVGDDFESPEVLNVYTSGNPVSLMEGRTGILKNSTFTIKFNEPMHYQKTLESVTLRERNGSPPVNVELSWSENFTELKVEPSMALEPETEYRLRVGTGAMDQSGNTLDSPFTLDFTVDDPSGELNSGFLTLKEVRKVYPARTRIFEFGEDQINELPLPAPHEAGWSSEFELEFSHSIRKSTALPENITVHQIAGAFSSSVYIESIKFPEDGRIVSLMVRGLHPNIYRLSIKGQRNGIKSTKGQAASSTRMKSDQVVYFRPEEG